MRNTKHQMKFLANRLLLALAWFTCCSWHEFIHETSAINLDKKNWTHPFMTCTLPYTMLKDCWVSLKKPSHDRTLLLSVYQPLTAFFSKNILHALYSSMSIVVFSLSSARFSSFKVCSGTKQF